MTPRETLLPWGEAAPWFEAKTGTSPTFAFSSLGGRFVALAFIGRADEPLSRGFLERLAAAKLPRDDDHCVRYAVSSRESDIEDPLATRAFPPRRVFHDPDGEIARAYGVLRFDPERQKHRYLQAWFILDPGLRVYASGGLGDAEGLIAALRALPPVAAHAGALVEPWAPVLLAPRILEPALCRALIALYERSEPEVSGFMSTENGKTVGRRDPSFKRRQDVRIQDEALREALRVRVRKRLFPEVAKAFQFQPTRIERYIVARYDDGDQGFFKPHRDDTTAATAHRRFAVTINLNAEDYEGGNLRFPEYGSRTYRAPTGGAVVFSCKLLHEATPVIRGTRYCTLPFLYDEAAAELRKANNAFLGEGVLGYRGREDRADDPVSG